MREGEDENNFFWAEWMQSATDAGRDLWQRRTVKPAAVGVARAHLTAFP